MRNSFLVMFLLLQSIMPVNGQRNAPYLTVDTLPLDPEVRYGKLANGFTYYIRRNNIPEGEIELHMVVKAGYYQEDKDQKEYAHLLEHVGAKATKHFPDIHSYFRSSGKYSHANTGQNYTAYYVKIPSGDKKVLQEGVLSVRDRAKDILMEQSVIDVQRGAVLGEMRTSDPYKDWLSRTIKKRVEKNTGFSSYTHEKYKKSIENFNREAFIRFYKDWYRPDLQAAIVVGDINVDSMEMHIKQIFSDLKKPVRPKNAQARVDAQTINLKGGNQYFSVKDTKREDFRVYIISKRPNYKYSPRNKSDYRKMLLQQLYREIMTPRGEYMIGQRNSPISNFSAKYRANQMAGGQLWVNEVIVNFDMNDPKHIKKRFIDALVTRKRMHTGFTKKELTEAKTKVLKSFSADRYESTSALAIRYKYHFTKGQAAPSPKDEKKLIIQLLDGIDLKVIQKFALDFVDLGKNTDFLFFKGKNVTIPSYDLIEKWVSDVNEMEVRPYTADMQSITSASLKNITDIPLKEKNVIKHTSESLIDVTTIELRNNVKVILKPTAPGGELFTNKVSLYAYRPFSMPFENRNDFLAATVSGKVVKHVGAGPFNTFELDQFMRDRGIQLNFNQTKSEQIINAHCQADHIEDFLNLLYLYIDKPKITPETFRDWKNHYKKQLKYGRRTSSAFFRDSIEALRFPDIPRMDLEDVNQLKKEKVHDVFNQLFSNFNGYTFILTGDFDKDQLTPILVKYLSAFPKGELQSSDTTNIPIFPLKKMNETIYLDNLNQALVRLSFPLKAPTDIKTKIILRLLAKALHTRIRDRLREGCYAPGANGHFVDTQKGLYEFIISFDSELSNLENMIRYAKEEFQSLRENGMDKQWFEKTVVTEEETFGKRIEYFNYASNNFWPGYLKEKLNNNEELILEVLQYKTLLEHFVSLEDVNAVAKKYLSEEFYQRFICLPKGQEELTRGLP